MLALERQTYLVSLLQRMDRLERELRKFPHVRKVTSVADYVKRQGRFRHLTDEQIAHIQTEVDERWAELERRVKGAGA